jgi:hypothetical protein
MLWRMEQKGFNHQAWHWMNVNIMPFIFHHGEFTILPQCLVSSKWTQRNRFLVSFIALPWITVLVRLQLHSSSTSKRVLWVHVEGVQEFLTWLLEGNVHERFQIQLKSKQCQRKNKQLSYMQPHLLKICHERCILNVHMAALKPVLIIASRVTMGFFLSIFFCCNTWTFLIKFLSHSKILPWFLVHNTFILFYLGLWFSAIPSYYWPCGG